MPQPSLVTPTTQHPDARLIAFAAASALALRRSRTLLQSQQDILLRSHSSDQHATEELRSISITLVQIDNALRIEGHACPTTCYGRTDGPQIHFTAAQYFAWRDGVYRAEEPCTVTSDEISGSVTKLLQLDACTPEEAILMLAALHADPHFCSLMPLPEEIEDETTEEVTV